MWAPRNFVEMTFKGVGLFSKLRTLVINNLQAINILEGDDDSS